MNRLDTLFDSSFVTKVLWVLVLKKLHELYNFFIFRLGS